MPEGHPSLYGICAEFNSPESLRHAATQIVRAGFTCTEAYSPFMVEGLAPILGFKERRIAPITLIAGILGALAGFGMCWYANVISYPLNIGGRPHNSWPAWIPITFEMTVLFSALAGAAAMLGFNGLPRLHHPIFETPHFERATTDRFFLCVEARDPRFDARTIKDVFIACDPLAVSEVRGMIKGLCCLLLLLPVACKPDDMADQPRAKPLGRSVLFHDHSASRYPPANTVPVNAPLTDEDDPSWQAPTTLTHFPFEITRADLLRGREQYEISCVACHGVLGDGHGIVPQRGFTRPPSYHTDRLRAAPPSYFYDVMTKGIGAMFPQTEHVSPDDRWRIAAYIRALQLAAYAPAPAKEEAKP